VEEAEVDSTEGEVSIGLKGGRPTGSASLKSKEAARRLKELDFDPIEKYVAMYEEVERQIHQLTHEDDGSFKLKYSQMALSQFMATKSNICAQLLRYGYARASETPNGEGKVVPTLTVITSKSKVEFHQAQAAVADALDIKPFKGDNE